MLLEISILAFHRFQFAYPITQVLTFLYRQVICGDLNRCNNGIGSSDRTNDDYKEWPWIGLTRIYSSTDQWQYLNGVFSPENDLWFDDLNQYDETNEPCAGLLGIEYNDPNFLRSYSYTCDSNSSGIAERPSICEFQC